MTLSAAVYQNEYLPAGTAEVNAIVTVTSEGGPAVKPGEKAIVLVVDTSTSMANPPAKIRAARKAAATAVGMIPDGTLFAVVGGSHHADFVYPLGGGKSGLVRADATTRNEAANVVSRLEVDGGTRISTWLDLTREIFEPQRGAICLAYLLTDGNDESESVEELEAAIARAGGIFQCDTRGVGSDWRVAELRKISSGLLGEVDIIPGPDEMDDDFRAFLDRAIGKTVPDVRLRIWTPKGSQVRFVRQVAPSIEDLTATSTAVNELTRDFATGAWSGDESRDYHLCVDVPVGQVGDEKLAARVTLMVGEEAGSQALVRAVWTDDESLSTRINPAVAHYTGQAELAQVIQEGLDARKQGDIDTATVKLGRAVQIAAASGNEGTVKLLRKVVDVEDPETGTVRVKRDVAALDQIELDTRSTRTVRVRKSES